MFWGKDYCIGNIQYHKGVIYPFILLYDNGLGWDTGAGWLWTSTI